MQGEARGGSKAEGGFALHQEKELHIWSRGRVLQPGLRSQGAVVSRDGHLTRFLSAWHLNPKQEIKGKNDRRFLFTPEVQDNNRYKHNYSQATKMMEPRCSR